MSHEARSEIIFLELGVFIAAMLVYELTNDAREWMLQEIQSFYNDKTKNMIF